MDAPRLLSPGVPERSGVTDRTPAAIRETARANRGNGAAGEDDELAAKARLNKLTKGIHRATDGSEAVTIPK